MDVIKLSYGVEVKYHMPIPIKEQQDAIFYTGMNCLATITCAGYSVDVYCDGDTKAELLKEAGGEVVATLYTPRDFIDAGINTDDAMRLATEQGILYWVNNSWFDLYCYGEHLDIVHHELIEALSSAVTYVQEQRDSEIATDTELDNVE